MKPDRLMGITVYLMKHGRTSAQKLAEEFEVSPRTIMRDIDALCRAGIPVVSFCGADGGYQLADGYMFEKQYATKDELSRILTALRGLYTARADSSIKRIIDKFGILTGDAASPVNIDLSAAREDARVNRMLNQIEQAVSSKRRIRFSYTNSTDETSEITAEPLQLEYKWYNWYLHAWYAKHGCVCTFKLLRMEDIRITDEDFSEADRVCIQNPSTEINYATVTLRCAGRLRTKCREYLRGEVTREFEDGSFEYRFTVPEKEIFWFGVVLSFGRGAQVISPIGIRQKIIETCREVLKQYE